jgi:hypothetical protein
MYRDRESNEQEFNHLLFPGQKPKKKKASGKDERMADTRDGRRRRLYGWDGARKRHPGPRRLGIGFEK